jgi:hypothetical protein
MQASGDLGENFRHPRQESDNRVYDPRRDHQQTRGCYSSRGQGRGQSQERPLYCMFYKKDTDYRTRDCPIFLESKKTMTQKHSQPSANTTAKEVNHHRNHHPQANLRTKISTLV